LRKRVIRRLIGLVAFLSLASACLAEAQPAKKIFRIGYLTNDSLSADLPRRQAFKQGLQDLGYVEGKDILIDYRVGEGHADRLPGFMAELLRLKVDVVFAFTTPGIQAAKNATRDVPIVVAAWTPVELGVVASLARPGGNITGLSLSAGPDLSGKYLELLKETVPRLSRVAVLANPANPSNVLQLKETRSAAKGLGLTLLAFDVTRPDEIDSAFTALKKQRAEAMAVLADPMLLGQGARIAGLALQGRLPSIYAISEHVEAGGLLGYAANRLDIFRRAATYVDKILKGAMPAELPIEQPTKFDLVVNLKTAKQLGLTIPPNVLLRADRVIQ